MQQSFSTLVDLLTRPEFLTGIAAGIVALAIVVAVARARGAGVAGWGLLLAAAVLVGIHLHIGRRLSLILALLVLAAGGVALDYVKHHPERMLFRNLGWALIIYGAFLFSTRSGLPRIDWVRIAAPVVVVVSALTMGMWREPERRWYVGPLFAITAFGVWTTVPETTSARVLIGASLPMALGTLGRMSASISGAGSFAVTGIAIWVVALGGETRPASIIGGWACVGIIVALPLLLRRRQIHRLRHWKVIAAHGLTVLLASRVVGLQESTTVALVGVVILAVAVVVVGLVASHPLPEDARAESNP